MTQSSFHITIFLPELPLHADATEKQFPKLTEALDRVAIDALGKWKTYALGGAPLPNGKTIKVYGRRYAESIAIRRTGKFAREVYNDLAIADQVENGFPARDLKRMLLTSRKVRMSKKGKRYLVIPFRHGTPGTNTNPMPQSVYRMAKRLSHSSIIGSRREMSINPDRKGIHRQITRLKYSWGDRLPPGTANKLNARHKSDPFAGMVKFQNPKQGGSKDTQYLTFRVMSEDSSGWLVRARPGYHVARTVAEQIKPEAQRELSRAYMTDINERAKSMFLTR